MTIEEVQRLIQGVFDNIFNSVTEAEPGGRPVAQASTTMLSLMKPGLAISSKDFRNPWTPGNTNGSRDAAINTARLVDVAPRLSSIYTESGSAISQVYKQILDGVKIPAQRPDPAIERQLQDAENYLFRLIDVTDSETGEVSKKKVESQVYRAYLDNQDIYNAARVAYMAAYLEAQKTATGRNTWPMLASTLQIPVRQAYDRWRAGDASKVEQNLAIKTTSTQNALQLAWKAAQDLYAGYGVILDESGTGLDVPIQRCTLLPSNWHSSSTTSTGWTTYDSAYSSVATSRTSEYTSYGGSAGFSLGIFSIGGSAGHSSQHQHASAETKNLRFSFAYTLVTIRRPWLTYNLLGTKGWSLGNLYTRGKISNGTKANQSNSVMPLLPLSFVVVKDVWISASWSRTDWDLIKSRTGGGGGFAIGPFSISGSYAHSRSKETFNSNCVDGNIWVPGVQIIGYISQVVPYCPGS